MNRFLLICAAMLAFSGQSLAQQSTQPPQAANAYQLGPGDRLLITVFGEEELTGEYAIGANGALTFPLIGDVPAAGLTPQQLSNAIAERLRGGYLREPRVASNVISYRPFYILGEVENPGTYPYVAELDVLSAVAIAGGFTYRANRRRVFIRRAGQSEEDSIRLDERVQVGPGDTVRIGERFF